MKPLLPLCFLTLLLLPLRADEQTRQMQSALKDAGFYYGPVDGAGGDETNAALRRYQIRNGLEVTGAATAETLSSLKIQGTPAQPLPEKIVSAAPVQEVIPQAPPPETIIGPTETQSTVAPVPLVKKPGGPALSDFFAGTEYAGVARQEQSLRLAKAQSQLRQLGYYSGLPDGLPGPNTEEALLKFQKANELRLTGRLDSPTTQILNATAAAVRGKKVRRIAPQAEPPAALRGVWVH